MSSHYSQSKAVHSTIVIVVSSAAMCGKMVANGYKQKLNTCICCLIIFCTFPGICNENQYKCDDGAGCYSKVTYIWLLVVGIIHDVSSLT